MSRKEAKRGPDLDMIAPSSSNSEFYENGNTGTRGASVEWVEIVEPQTKQRMYANLVTGQCAWEPPPEATVKHTHEHQWWELFDSKTGRYYYYNAATSCTKWQKPLGVNVDIIPLAKLQTLKEHSEGASPKVRRSSETQTSPSVRRMHQNYSSTRSQQLFRPQCTNPEYDGVASSYRTSSRSSQQSATMNGMQSSFDWMSLDEEGVLSESGHNGSEYGNSSSYTSSHLPPFPTGGIASSTLPTAQSSDSIPTENRSARSVSPPAPIKRLFFSSGTSTKQRNGNGWSKDAPKTALTQPDNKQLKKETQALFKIIQGYMGDRKSKTNQDQIALSLCELAYKKIEIGDEAVALLMQQLSDNEKPDSLRRGWELLSILLAFVVPTGAISEKLVEFLDKNADPVFDRPEVVTSYFAQQCQKRLCKTVPRAKPTLANVQETKIHIFRPPLFSASLEELMEMQQEKFPKLELPWVLTTLIELLIQSGGRRTEGIFRVAADPEQLNTARGQLDGWLTPKMHDANVPAGLLKLWLRQLPVPLILPGLYDRALAASDSSTEAIKIVKLLPEMNQLVLARVLALLQDLSREEVVSKTKMDVSNLAMVIAPNVLRCESEDPRVIFENTRREMSFMKTLILHFDTTFVQNMF